MSLNSKNRLFFIFWYCWTKKGGEGRGKEEEEGEGEGEGGAREGRRREERAGSKKEVWVW